MKRFIAAAVIEREPPLFLMLPFALLLASIAVAPLILGHHWERHYHKLCLGLAAIVSAYYIFELKAVLRVLHAGGEYFSFMVVVGSFFVASGGIHLRAKDGAKPVANTLFLFGGALLANIIGTIGASMLLIRPWIEMNRSRFAGMHLAFFIFVVSNVGGALLPTGPPLFLGYLKGVPFFWNLMRCWPQWLVTLGSILLIFYIADRLNFCTRAKPLVNEHADSGKPRCDGAANFILLLAILVALIVLPAYWREATMLGLAFVSYWRTSPRIRLANAFSFAPIKEVGWLFLGIFGTMIPVLDYMELHAANLGLHSDLQFYWATGVLSALLDNAPTYLTLLAGALGLHNLDMNNATHMSEFIRLHDHYLVAIALGATCFGALTYIGNGPNLLVKAIAERAQVPTPSFFGYAIKYAIPVLIPIFVLVSYLFFRK